MRKIRSDLSDRVTVRRSSYIIAAKIRGEIYVFGIIQEMYFRNFIFLAQV